MGHYDNDFPLERLMERHSLSSLTGLEAFGRSIERWFKQNTPLRVTESNIENLSGGLRIELGFKCSFKELGLPDFPTLDSYFDFAEGSAEEEFNGRVFPYFKEFSPERYILSWSALWADPQTLALGLDLG